MTESSQQMTNMEQTADTIQQNGAKQPRPITYQTTCEKEFIDGIVSGKWVKEPHLIRAKKALQGYIDASKKRIRWPADCDGADCIAHAEGVLRWL